jgi:hypothetical protein
MSSVLDDVALWFSKSSVHQNHMEGYLKTCLEPGPTKFLIQWNWDDAWEFECLTSS